MELHNLKPAEGSTKDKKRIARGQGSGRGGTATKGHKGAKSRAGYKSKRAFEGGQMPLQMRLPKFGFKNPNRVEYVKINLDQLQELARKWGSDQISFDLMVEKKYLGAKDLLKVLGRGAVEQKLNVTAHAFSASARQAIEAQGGSANQL